ncbi:MAG TPA: DUF5671 domain-containing protein [Candidatus Saccharimonadia bacterium]|nr:DUF5671 domain-containing protein [Candidatus Saccharimonadia bacterium]
MNQQLLQYITFARSRKLSDQDIRDNLVGAGWEAGQVAAALKAGDEALLMPPPPPGVADHDAGSQLGDRHRSVAPIAVVQQRTTRGLEYTIMFLALGVTAVSLGALLHNVVDLGFGRGDNANDSFISFAASALIVGLPIFALLFLRLKRAELAEPGIRADASRRHAVQLTLIVTFIWGLFRLVTYIYSLMNGTSSDYFLGVAANTPAFASFLHTLVTVGIAGSIFAYYWRDEHHKGQ